MELNFLGLNGWKILANISNISTPYLEDKYKYFKSGFELVFKSRGYG